MAEENIDGGLPPVEQGSPPETVPEYVIISVEKITAMVDDALTISCTVSINGAPPQVFTSQIYRTSDPYGMNPALGLWLAANPDFPIGSYVPPPPPTVEEIRARMLSLTARQFRLGLVNAGISPSQVTATIAAMPAGPVKEKAQIEWEYATTFSRMHPLIATVGSALGLNDTQIDAMWLAAVNL